MPINHKQQAFINEYMVNGHNATKAYKKAYPDSSDKACESNGARLISNDKIKQAIAGMMAAKGAETAMTLDRVQAMYLEAYELGKESKQSSSMVSACTGIARLYGMDKDNQLNTEAPTELSPEQIQEALQASKSITSIKLAIG
jgi:phage terminase small subunit